MADHRLITSFTLPRTPEQVFPFFADALNLEAITPPELRFAVLTPRPIVMGAGTILDYRLGLFGFPVRWRSEITLWAPPLLFVDEARRSPYALWVHRHQFEAIEGGSRVTEEVRYRLPLQPLGACPSIGMGPCQYSDRLPGELAHPLVRRQLQRIFQFREAAIRKILVGG